MKKGSVFTQNAFYKDPNGAEGTNDSAGDADSEYSSDGSDYDFGGQDSWVGDNAADNDADAADE